MGKPVSTTRHPTIELYSLPSIALILAQSFSALADTAFLLIAIMSVRNQAGGDAAAGVVQQCYVLPFFLLAPLAGAIVNTTPKRKVMAIATGLKWLAALGLACGAMPWVMMGVAGIGAVMYSPAKYGILYQVFDETKLIMANALVEGSTILMVVAGTIAGGMLADRSFAVALQFVLVVYLVSCLCLLAVPALAAERTSTTRSISDLLQAFKHALFILFAHGAARFSLIGTSFLVAGGTTLRLLILAWVPVALLLHDHQTPALLLGGTSIGVVIGALLAGRIIRLDNIRRVVVPGTTMGVLIVVLGSMQHILPALAVAVAIGVCGGAFAVPLNALLQKKGAETVGTGYALTVQNFSENAATIVLVGIYSAIMGSGLSVQTVMLALGISICAAMPLILWGCRNSLVPA